MRFVLSTIGTSILTNFIDKTNFGEANWQGMLRDSANLKPDELPQETTEVIETLADRALTQLLEDNAATNRRISAELNGIYGIYEGQLPRDSQDQHYLICTDTAQGQKTGKLIQDFLENKEFQAGIVTPAGLSTQGPESFSAGAKELIRWLEENVPWRRDMGYRVIFNLVGGFKSLQGYMNTFGAFYADEVVYIFEAPTADLIKIPRLPIQIDTTVIQNHRVQFAMMDAEKLYPVEELEGIPETLLDFVKENGQTYAGLSAWGQLIWNRTKSDLLTKELLNFPRLEYQRTFRNDFNNETETKARFRLQETLAKVAYLLEQSNGNRAPLMRDGGLQFEKFTNIEGIYKFRIDRVVRVSCSVSESGLILRHYGHKNVVYENP